LFASASVRRRSRLVVVDALAAVERIEEQALARARGHADQKVAGKPTPSNARRARRLP
jgi:hypothetical protein